MIAGGWAVLDYRGRPYNYNVLVAPLYGVRVAQLNPLTWLPHSKVVLGMGGGGGGGGGGDPAPIQ